MDTALLGKHSSVRSQPSTLVHARVGYEFDKNWRVLLDVFNVFNKQVSDIDYYYVSRLQGEPAAGVADIHTHPEDPREARLTLFLRGSEYDVLCTKPLHKSKLMVICGILKEGVNAHP